MALALPRALANREDIIAMTFGVVVFSVVVQGRSMPMLLKGLKPDAAND